jgi:hypothetical protein
VRKVIVSDLSGDSGTYRGYFDVIPWTHQYDVSISSLEPSERKKENGLKTHQTVQRFTVLDQVTKFST